MIDYNTLQRMEEDTDKCVNYITVNYEPYFPEESVLQERDKKMDSYMRRSPIFAITSDSDNCQKGD